MLPQLIIILYTFYMCIMYTRIYLERNKNVDKEMNLRVINVMESTAARETTVIYLLGAWHTRTNVWYIDSSCTHQISRYIYTFVGQISMRCAKREDEKVEQT